MFGVALQGGGTLGAAHVGVLRALVEAGLSPEIIGGTSAGAIAAAAYGWRGRLSDLEELFSDIHQMGAKLLDLNLSGIFKMVGNWFARHELGYLGIFKGDRLERLMDDHLEGTMIRDARMPLVIPAVDIISGELMLYSSRPPIERGLDHWSSDVLISEAVRASTSIPIVFVPKAQPDEMLVDGGLLMNLPISAVRQMGADRVLGVSLSVEDAATKRPGNVIDIAHSLIDTVEKQLLRRQRQTATYVLDIILPHGNGVFSFDHMDEFVDIGYETALKAMPEIKAAFNRTVQVGAKPAAAPVAASARAFAHRI